MFKIGNEWDHYLGEEFEKPYFVSLMQKVQEESERYRVFPANEHIFNAMRYTPYNKVKVLLLGQDPYHEIGQAHGLAFSVQRGVQIPPSLRNMYKELHDDIGFQIPSHGCLTDWAEQGVMLLNTVLTVREGNANSHKNFGWTTFTDRIIQVLNEREAPVIFLLWGRNAADKLPFITNKQHFVLSAAHPSPLSASRGFFGCKHFSKVNEILRRLNKDPIDWQIKE